VTVRVCRREIPAELVGRDPIRDKALRQRIGAWIEAQWTEKDQLIDELLRAAPAAATAAGNAAPEVPAAEVPATD
jgi:hypothetical protein